MPAADHRSVVRSFARQSRALALGAVALLWCGPRLAAQEVSRAEALERAVARGIEYLRTQGQADDGSYSAQAGPAVTALVTHAILRHGRSPNDPQVAQALAYLQKFVQPDGGLYNPESNYKNYETCLSILCFQAANADDRYKELLAGADRFIRDQQWDESENHDPSSTYFGGAGYGGKKRPDLSNTSFFIDALRAGGAGADDPAVQRALVFISRCQNLETEHNATPFAALNPDGGFYYTPAAEGASMAGQTENGGLRSYGSMTYAGLKSMLYAGLTPDDPRVAAAVAWLQKAYTLEMNPGMGDAGLYYYYNTFAKALDAIGEEVFVDEQGAAHAWREELLDAIVARQQENGSWLNPNTRWLEGDANLVTGYALLALSYCRPPQAAAE